MLLKVLEEKTDIKDVGDLDSALKAPVEDDAPEPIEVLAHLLAHVFHRIPGVRWISKKLRLEGEGKSAGMGSDIISLIVQLYRRNEDVIKAVIAAEIRKIMKDKKSQAESVVPIRPVEEVQ